MFHPRVDEIATYEMWAPPKSVWSRWAKPVLFMTRRSDYTQKPASTEENGEMFDVSPDEFEVSPIAWFGDFRQDTAIILDLPGVQSVEEALAFAKIGYRPVPLYNGVDSVCSPVVDTNDIVRMLFKKAEELAAIRLPADAPPVFMLDANRKGKRKAIPGEYDNRWNIFAQDMPSADFFRSRGIRNILARTHDSRPVAIDLQHVLYRYAESKAVTILRYGGYSIRPYSVAKPAFYKSVFYRLKTILGLERNAAGGFGVMIALPSNTGYGYSGG